MESERYENLDGLRAYACIGIVLMHVLDNGKYGMGGFIFETFIFSFTNFTFLFMLLSAFSMCCGYYKRFQDNTVSLEQFYRRRYQRIWPYFALLCTIELIVDHSLKSLCEWFADLTLAFGLIPNNNIEIVGVGWFLGTIFVFYMIFPFFVFLMKNKKRAWFVLGITVILHILCTVHFTGTGGRANIIFSAMFFVAGGIIYLYREVLDRIRILALGMMIISLVAFYTLNYSEIVTLIGFSSLTIIVISCDNKLTKAIFQNKMARFLGSVSMEMYLCHMFVFRGLEKLQLTHITQNRFLNYVLVSLATIIGAIVMALVLKKLIGIVQKKMSEAV